jgi:hypothetical protein
VIKVAVDRGKGSNVNKDKIEGTREGIRNTEEQEE